MVGNASGARCTPRPPTTVRIAVAKYVQNWPPFQPGMFFGFSSDVMVSFSGKYSMDCLLNLGVF